MEVREEEFEIARPADQRNLIEVLQNAVATHLGRRSRRVPIRFVVTQTTDQHYHCELGLIDHIPVSHGAPSRSIFEFRRRTGERTGAFNAALVIPTGIGCEIGGHAGDAAPVVRLLASMCDTLVTHPNAVNGSDINDLPDNALYVEGSVLTRLVMGTVGLQPVRANRVLAVMEAHDEPLLAHVTANSVNAARVSFGLDCPRLLMLSPSVKLASRYSRGGRAAGVVHDLDRLMAELLARRGTFDAVAISTRVEVAQRHRSAYYKSQGEVVNPWGGVEALLTHAVSHLIDAPAAHAPMFDSVALANVDWGIVDPRMAAEVISNGFFLCVLKGLQRSPRILDGDDATGARDALGAADLACLVIPDQCIGLPTLAALEQGIPVIAVRENRNVMRNDLTQLPWGNGQLHIVENYWEAAGVMASIKAGIAPRSVRRPIEALVTEHGGSQR